MGELGPRVPVIAVAPAIANAIWAAVRIRLHALPLVPSGYLPPPAEPSGGPG